jgi:hypothetical protein
MNNQKRVHELAKRLYDLAKEELALEKKLSSLNKIKVNDKI